MIDKMRAGISRRLAPVSILFALSLVCVFLFLIGYGPYQAFPAEKQIARSIELASFGADHFRNNIDYCVPKLGLPVCSAERLENSAPGTPCFMQKCSWGHVTSLNLFGGQLAELPADIGRLPILVELDLHGNNLNHLPPEIGRLSHLTELDLSGNHLTNLPAEIGQLINLRKLDLSGNQLTSLPTEIGLLHNLTYLNLNGNPLDGPLPAFLTHLPLKELVFSKTDLCVPVDEDFQNWIRSVYTINVRPSPHPSEICSLVAEDQQAMKALYEMPGRPVDWDLNKIPCTWSSVGCDTVGHILHLDLSSIRLSSLPPEIWQLSHLQSLNLTHTQLLDLPPDLGKLSSLTHLYLSGNQLTDLPPEIGLLRELKELTLDHNRLKSLPPQIGQLQSLSSLNLSGNQLTILPPEIGKLTQLTLLDVSANSLNGPLPGFLTDLQNVTFVFSNTSLCVPKDAGILDWLGRQSTGIYTYTESGELAYTPPDPGAFTHWYLEHQGCK